MRNFVVSVERARVSDDFVLSVEIMAVVDRPRLEVFYPVPAAAWEEHMKARQGYSKALEVWCQSEHLVTSFVALTASATHATVAHASETSHHVMAALARAAVDKMGVAELFEGRKAIHV